MISETELLILAAAGAAYIVVAAVVIAVRVRRNKEPRYFREFLKLAFFLYIVFLLRLTILPAFHIRRGYLSVNLVPFQTISGYIGSVFSGDVSLGVIRENLLGNIALFVPMGLLAPAIWPRFRRLWKAVLFGMLFSAGIELAQLAFSLLGMLYRTTDVDDVILNTSGALMGYGLYALIRLMIPSRTARASKAGPPADN
jgi:glycopeptide antibiotics resistance protein